MSDQPLPREADDRGTLKKGVAVGRGPAPKYPPAKPPTPPIEAEAESLTAIDRAIRDHLFATAIHEEAELVKELAPSHHCMSNWAGDHCTVCSAHKGTALRTAERFNAYVAAQSADIDRLTRERDEARRLAKDAGKFMDDLMAEVVGETNRAVAAERTVREQRERADAAEAELVIANRVVQRHLPSAVESVGRDAALIASEQALREQRDRTGELSEQLGMALMRGDTAERTVREQREALEPFLKEVAWSLDYHESDDVQYPGYIWIDWDDLVHIARVFAALAPNTEGEGK